MTSLDHALRQPTYVAQRSGRVYYSRPKITPEFVQELTGYLREGAELKIASRRAKVPYATVAHWLRQGAERLAELDRDGRDAMNWPATLFLAVENALGDRDWMLEKAIIDAKPGDEWRAKAWLLERLARDEFGQVQTASAGPVTIVVQTSFPGIGPSEAIEVEAREIPEIEEAEHGEVEAERA